jgi:hypothetical protein
MVVVGYCVVVSQYLLKAQKLALPMSAVLISVYLPASNNGVVNVVVVCLVGVMICAQSLAFSAQKC